MKQVKSQHSSEASAGYLILILDVNHGPRGSGVALRRKSGRAARAELQDHHAEAQRRQQSPNDLANLEPGRWIKSLPNI